MPRRTKDAAIALLVVVNVVLLCTVLGYVVAVPRANGQAVPDQLAPGPTGGGSFLAVAGQIQTGLDAQYVIDVNQQRLYVFSPARTGGSTVTMQLTDTRDLRADFAKQSSPTIPPRAR
jgi:hypothetical protein